MEAFVYTGLPGRVVFGEGALKQLAAEVERLGARRAFVITTPHQKADGEALGVSLGSSFAALYSNATMHTPVEVTDDALAAAKAAGADCLVALGGGSTIGLAKAIALRTDLPQIAIPTTYAGSEMTPIWGLTSGARKDTGRDPAVQPRTVVYDPRLTLSLPPEISGPSGMNALAHCVEALYADGANPITSLMAEQGIRVLARGLPHVVADPADLDGRTEVLAGAYLAGAAFAVAGSGIHHKICHVLGGAYDLPHAEMHTIVLPHAVAHVAPFQPEAIGRMAAALGEPDVAGAIFDLARKIGAPAGLAEIGMPRDRIDEAATLVAEASVGSSVEISGPDARALLDHAFDGLRPASRHAVARTINA
jgi:maleylacetate reductase